MMKGTIRFKEGKGFYVEHTPKNIFANCSGVEIMKTFYQELMLDPFTDNTIYKDGDEVNFIKEIYTANEGSYYFAEIVKC